jgi:hypothetical protein
MMNLMFNLGKAEALNSILKRIKERLDDEMVDTSKFDKAYSEIMEIFLSSLPSETKEDLIYDRLHYMFDFFEQLLKEPEEIDIDKDAKENEPF